MSNSPLVDYTLISPNQSGRRSHAIDRITPHCVVGQCSVETLGNIFAPTSRGASSNYGIGNDARVGMYVEECDRSWCTSSSANDDRAVTIECASDTFDPYAFKEIVFEKLIELCVDICQRNGKNKVVWLGSLEATNAYSQKSNEMVFTVHRWYKNKSCPGDWLFERMDELTAKVNLKLSGEIVEPIEEEVPETPAQLPAQQTLYRVQVGAFSHKEYADDYLNKVKAAGFDGFVFRIGNLYKVQVGAFLMKCNADNYCEKLKAAGFHGAFIAMSTVAPARKPVEDIAREVIAGKWGSGAARKAALESAGYDYNKVQSKVNELL